MSITTHEANDGEKLINIKYFSFNFNFSEKKRKERIILKKEDKKRRFWKKRGKRGKRGGVGCQNL